MDDLLVIGNNEELVRMFKEDMNQTFEMTYLGKMAYFLGMEIKQKNGEVLIFQKKYAKKILKKFRLDECKCNTPT